MVGGLVKAPAAYSITFFRSAPALERMGTHKRGEPRGPDSISYSQNMKAATRQSEEKVVAREFVVMVAIRLKSLRRQ
jgi:hypothetical protein